MFIIAIDIELTYQMTKKTFKKKLLNYTIILNGGLNRT